MFLCCFRLYVLELRWCNEKSREVLDKQKKEPDEWAEVHQNKPCHTYLWKNVTVGRTVWLEAVGLLLCLGVIGVPIPV